jgi:hypothetical protein
MRISSRFGSASMGRYRVSNVCEDTRFSSLRYVGLVILLIEQQATLDLEYDMTYMYNPFVTIDSRRSQGTYNGTQSLMHRTVPSNAISNQEVKIIQHILAVNPKTHHAARLAVVLISVIFFAFFFLPVGTGFSALAALLSPFSDTACTCAISSFSASSSFSQS